MSIETQRSTRPHLACEIAPDRVVAARASRNGGALEGCSSRSLRVGSVTPSLIAGNVGDPAALRQAISETLGDVTDRTREVITILPDSAVRVVLLDFDELPAKRQEADAMVRFRLKKALPFDVDQAAVSYDVRVRDGVTKVLSTIALRSVLDEYEGAVRDAGYNPGVVIPSMIAMLGTVQANEPTLVVKVDSGTTTLAIVDSDQLLLFRTLENPPGNQIDPEQLAADIYPSLIFFEDNYSVQVKKILVAGRASSSLVGPALQAQSGAQVSGIPGNGALASAASGVPPEQLVGVAGALS